MNNTHDIDLVLINPANRKRIYQVLSKSLSAIEPPVWAGLMATYVRKKGLSVAIVDMSAEEDITVDDVAKLVQDMNPLLVSIVVYGQQPSASTQVMPGASAVATAIKQLTPDQTTMMVGGHVAALPERSLREENVDYIASGEGLMTMVQLVECLKNGKADIHKVLDLWYWEDDNIRMNTPAPLLKDLEGEMPGIAWDLLPMDKYRSHNWHALDTLDRSPYVALYTTLGCPYHCSFCCIQAPFKSGEQTIGMKSSVNSYRFWSPQMVGDWIEDLVTNYGVRNIKFADEMFVLNRRHVSAISDEITKRGLDVNIWAYTRVDTVKDGMIEKLKAAGINWLAFGIEAASERVRDQVQKGVAQEDIFRVIRDVQAGGINVIGNFIFGLPEDDHETMQETLDMAVELNPEFANFYCAMAYPGSELYETALQNNWELPSTWAGYSQHAKDTQPLPTNYISAAEVLAFRDDAFMKFFTSDRYLDMVEKKFGSNQREHIQYMTSYTLERDLLAHIQ